MIALQIIISLNLSAPIMITITCVTIFVCKFLIVIQNIRETYIHIYTHFDMYVRIYTIFLVGTYVLWDNTSCQTNLYINNIQYFSCIYVDLTLTIIFHLTYLSIAKLNSLTIPFKYGCIKKESGWQWAEDVWHCKWSHLYFIKNDMFLTLIRQF